MANALIHGIATPKVWASYAVQGADSSHWLDDEVHDEVRMEA